MHLSFIYERTRKYTARKRERERIWERKREGEIKSKKSKEGDKKRGVKHIQRGRYRRKWNKMREKKGREIDKEWKINKGKEKMRDMERMRESEREQERDRVKEREKGKERKMIEMRKRELDSKNKIG